MTINTQKLRDLIRRAVPLPWALATSNSYRRIVRADRYEEVCSPVKMPDGHPDLWFPDGFEGPNAQLLIGAVNALPDLLDIIDAANEQVAEYARMLEKQSAEADARIDAQTAEIAGARQTIERWKERCRAARQESGALKRDITDYIRIGNSNGAEIARLRYALRWTAAALQEACRRPTIIDVKDRWRIDRETRTTGEILASADVALAQEQGGSDA